MSSAPDNAAGGPPAPVAGEGDGPPVAAGRPVLDVLAVLAAMQQQLDDVREVVQAQQTTLQALLDSSTSRPARCAVGGAAGGR